MTVWKNDVKLGVMHTDLDQGSMTVWKNDVKLLHTAKPATGPWHPRAAPAKFIILHAKFIILNTKFIVLNLKITCARTFSKTSGCDEPYEIHPC